MLSVASAVGAWRVRSLLVVGAHSPAAVCAFIRRAVPFSMTMADALAGLRLSVVGLRYWRTVLTGNSGVNDARDRWFVNGALMALPCFVVLRHTLLWVPECACEGPLHGVVLCGFVWAASSSSTLILPHPYPAASFSACSPVGAMVGYIWSPTAPSCTGLACSLA